MTLTQAQKDSRTEYIGGSDIAAVMGLSRWVTRLQLWAEKTGKIQPQDLSDNEAVELGIDLEDFVAKRFEKKTGLKVRRDSTDYTHPDYPFMKAHIDRRIVGTDEVLECKTAHYRKEKEWEGDEIPTEYVLQVNWQIGIVSAHLGRPFSKGWLEVLIGGQKSKRKHLDFNPELFDRQVEAAKAFWDLVKKDVPPAAGADDGDILFQLFPESTPEVLQIDDEAKKDEIDTLLEHRLELIQEINAAETEQDALDATLKQMLGTHESGETDKYRFVWKKQKRVYADMDKLREDQLLDRYSKVSEFRKFNVYSKTKKGEKK